MVGHGSLGGGNASRDMHLADTTETKGVLDGMGLGARQPRRMYVQYSIHTDTYSSRRWELMVDRCVLGYGNHHEVGGWVMTRRLMDKCMYRYIPPAPLSLRNLPGVALVTVWAPAVGGPNLASCVVVVGG